MASERTRSIEGWKEIEVLTDRVDKGTEGLEGIDLRHLELADNQAELEMCTVSGNPKQCPTRRLQF